MKAVWGVHTKELQKYEGQPVHLQLKEGAVPQNMPARRVPLSLQKEVEDTLKEMVKQGVITLEPDPTQWCSPMLVRRKPNGKLRICMGPRYLNKFLERPMFPLPDTEQVFAKNERRSAFYDNRSDQWVLAGAT